MPKSLIITILIVLASGFNPCSVVQFSDYSFDLAGLRNSTITFPDRVNYVKVTPCYITACDQNPTSQKSFAIKGGNNTCQPYTSIHLFKQSMQPFSKILIISTHRAQKMEYPLTTFHMSLHLMIKTEPLKLNIVFSTIYIAQLPNMSKNHANLTQHRPIPPSSKMAPILHLFKTR